MFKKYIILVFILLGAAFLPVSVVFAGTILSSYKYAWSNNIGYLNFSNVSVSDSALSGYAWSANHGWIKFNPAQGGVLNNGQGNLSGYAWGENLGWIDFDNVSISTVNGKFSGTATSTLIGTLTFNCNYCDVRTDWRPQSAGGGAAVQWNNPPTPPSENFGILINDGKEFTNTSIVTLTLRGGLNTERMAISNFSDFRDIGQENYQTIKEWDLCKELTSCPEGEYTVYVKFYAPWGKSSEVVSDKIIYKKEAPIVELPLLEVKPLAEKPEKSIIGKVSEILKSLVPEFLKPKPPETKPIEVPIEELVAKETPLAFQVKWQLLPSKQIREFVLAPLPKEIRKLVEKFPEFGETLKKIGITKITDIGKLKNVKLTLPGLTQRVGFPIIKDEWGKFALPTGIPIVKLTPKIKQKIPTEIVFVKTGGELIDFNIALSINEKGESKQKISTISGKPMQLVVKPDKPVKSVKGYLVFKSKTPRQGFLKFNLNNLIASLIFAEPVFAKAQEKPVRVEEKLVLLEFEYTDPDGDGIYTAEIQAPVVEGEYEIITVMDFEDPELGRKEIRLITVIDPEGYIYEKIGNKETRIPGAIVSLFWLNPITKQYELWPAKEYQQENLQITDIKGTYSFLVPEGFYYLKVEAPGYLVYADKPFQVKEGSGIHVNIELKTKYWWLKIVDWKTVLLGLVIILLFYNFYRDKMRDRIKNYESRIMNYEKEKIK